MNRRTIYRYLYVQKYLELTQNLPYIEAEIDLVASRAANIYAIKHTWEAWCVEQMTGNISGNVEECHERYQLDR